MQQTTPSRREPRVVTIRIRRRLAPLLGLLVVIAMLPALAGSGATPHTGVALIAGAPTAGQMPNETPADGDEPEAVGGGPAAPPGLQAAGTSVSVAEAMEQLGTGTQHFLFPSLELAVSQTDTTDSAAARSGLSWPLHGPVASGFGPRIHPVLGRPMFHTGIDLMAACGTPIHAAADGQVVYAAITPSWGRRVIIRHSTSLETGYAHMSRFLVQEGDVVKRGQVIGLVGTTGWSTGCHLHFDVIVDGNYVDPAPYLGLPGTSNDEVPYQAAPHVEAGTPGTPPRTVEDGDVPVTSAVPTSKPATPTTPPTTLVTEKPAPSTSSTKQPTTTEGPTTTVTPSHTPTTSSTSTTTEPTTTTPTTPTTPTAPPTSTGETPTTTQPPTTSASPTSTVSPTTTKPPTTSQAPTGSSTSVTPTTTSSTTHATSTTPPTTGNSSCDCPTSSDPTGEPTSSEPTSSEPSSSGCPGVCATATGTATASVTATIAATTEALLSATTASTTP